VLETLRRAVGLLGEGQRSRWVLVLVLALLATGMEAVGALAVFGLLARITTDVSGFELPVVGDLRDLLPAMGETTLLVIVGGLVAGFFVARAAVLVAQAYVQHRIAENAGARLSGDLLEGYLAMPYTFHLRRNSAELIRNAYDIVQQFVREGLIPAVHLVSHSLMIVGLLAVLLVTSPGATLVAVGLLGPLTWLLLRFVQPKVKRFGRTSQRVSRDSLQTLHESLGGWRDITILGRRRAFVDRFRADRSRLARSRYLKATARVVPRVALETGLVLFILAFLGVSVLLQGGALQALPVLGLFGYVAVRLQPSLNEVLNALNALKFVGPGIDLLHDDVQLFRAGGRVQDPDVTPLQLTDRLEIRDAAVRYPGSDHDAIADVDLEIRAGEFVGIVGPTGGGKSTLVDLLLGLLEPRVGRVEVDGVDVAGATDAWHASLGVVHQDVFLTDATLRENIALGVPADEVDEARVLEAVALARLDGFVASLPDGLDTAVGERGVRVSGGQRQRLAIARALYRRPSVLVFDEGTSALDTTTEALLMEGLESLRGEHTIVVVAHRLSTVRSCDRVVLIEDGRVLDVAPFDELADRHRQLLRSAH
jgi:ABC-type multidrug transport system fused ATPase/permease subunit